MSSFERLDSLVQHHIVNTLGWRELRPLQEMSIGPVMDGDHCLLLAPTAGGKTESAMFPVLSRMCTEAWPAPSVVYVCPLKALINNLGARLDQYTRMLGRRSSVWHGDIGESARRGVRNEPPDVILTTPESLEAMLVSTNPQMRSNLQAVRVVIVDEVHAFAGDDRGWHLLALLERMSTRAGNEIQRIGLSATVGNPEHLLRWLTPKAVRPLRVIQSPTSSAAAPEVTLDYVGSLENAAIVISRLHRGEKRLVFCDSRSRVEALAGFLRSFGVQTYVSHSSLSASERRIAEEAFATGDDCVIVSTSTLELGIDVGDLDRVIQIDSPGRVASFLQRLGRTGRRARKVRNCLFLCTTERALLRGAAIIRLWKQGYVEPIEPPLFPYHVFAQQVMALCLERGGIGRNDIVRQLEPLLTDGKAYERADQILAHMVSIGIVCGDEMRYFIGEAGESAFGRRHFLELLSVFDSPPVLKVTDGRQDLGMVDQGIFFGPQKIEERVLSLAGRSWLVQRVDWKERLVYVLPAETQGKTVWLGAASSLPITTCRAVKDVLAESIFDICWSQRTVEQIGALRNRFSFLKFNRTTFATILGKGHCWYTFAGLNANTALAEVLQMDGLLTEEVDDYVIRFKGAIDSVTIESLLTKRNALAIIECIKSSEEAEEALKFSQCLPSEILQREVVARRCSVSEIDRALVNERAFVVLDGNDFERL